VTVVPVTFAPAVTFLKTTTTVPVGLRTRVDIFMEIPSTVIAPGVKEAPFCCDVVTEVLSASESLRLPTKDHVDAVVQFPVAELISVAIYYFAIFFNSTLK